MAKRRREGTALRPGEVGPRQPCPCGSGRRYKACHGAPGGASPYVARTFEGLPGECDWVALREFVPAGTATATLRPGVLGSDGPDDLMVASLLPGVAPALKREDGAVWLALQAAHRSGDASNDLAEAVELAAAAEPGAPVALPRVAATTTRLQDLVAEGSEFPVTVHDSFDFWFDGEPDPTTAATLEQVNASLEPTSRLTTVDAAYWTSTDSREHLRWVLPHDEEQLLTALARLHVAGADRLVPGDRLVGSFRAHGLLIVVWDLPEGTGADALESPATEFADRLDAALAAADPLTADERSARNGLTNRQLTVRR